MTATGMPRSILVLLAALTTLVVSLSVSAGWLLVSPGRNVFASRWIAAAGLVIVGVLVVSARAMLRGSRPAWLLACASSGLVLAASLVAAGYAVTSPLRPPPGVQVGDATVVIETEPTLLESAGDGSPLIIVGAALATAALVRPRTRRDLRDRAPAIR